MALRDGLQRRDSKDRRHWFRWRSRRFTGGVWYPANRREYYVEHEGHNKHRNIKEGGLKMNVYIHRGSTPTDGIAGFSMSYKF